MTRSGSVRRRPTIADVAQAAGVSRTTVSHALNGIGKVDPRTRARIKQVADELGYRPSLRAQRLRRGEAKAIALLSSMPLAVAGGPSRLGFYMEVAAAAAEHALAHDYALMLLPPGQSGAGLRTADIDGAIVVEPGEADSVVAELRDRGLPHVALGRPAPDAAGVPYVDLRGEAVARLLLDHLWEQGARRPALVTGAAGRHSSVDARAVFARRAEEHGWPPVTAEAAESGGEQAGYETCTALLRDHPETDALCVLVDAFAVGAVQAVRDSGRTVPDDVMVVTRYDGLRAQTCRPPLTAVDLHLEQAAAEAVELLLDRLHVAHAAPGRASRLPAPRLVIRASSTRGTGTGTAAGDGDGDRGGDVTARA